jgi:hypothetical protein
MIDYPGAAGTAIPMEEDAIQPRDTDVAAATSAWPPTPRPPRARGLATRRAAWAARRDGSSDVTGGPGKSAVGSLAQASLCQARPLPPARLAHCAFRTGPAALSVRGRRRTDRDSIGVVSQRAEISRLGGKFRFTAEGLCISRDMLAAQLGPVNRGEDLRISVWLPSNVFDSQELPDGTDLVEVEDFVIEAEKALSPPLVLRGPAGETDLTQPDPEVVRQRDSLSRDASVIAHDFLAWIRLRLRQYWIAPVGTPSPHESVVWDADCGDILARQELSPGRPIPFTMLADVPGQGIVLSRRAILPGLNEILAGKAPGDAGLPERLLSSAFGKLWSAYPDPPTAVFLSAVACETKVKTALRAKAAVGQRPVRASSRWCGR